ncbi:hypothetical protein [Sutterella sp.]|uniref:hypothetical protein n=1 Tax=Sutterella sp. TaxID=1981025 RepID=UPI0026E024BA|nr:hypothetical protein [Sutterella sp.]MDO5532349.1 hypothetical protein [Sutterella sp.]
MSKDKEKKRAKKVKERRKPEKIRVRRYDPLDYLDSPEAVAAFVDESRKDSTIEHRVRCLEIAVEALTNLLARRKKEKKRRRGK